MKIQITRSLWDFKKFLKELRKDEKQYNYLRKTGIGLYWIISVVLFTSLSLPCCAVYKLNFLETLLLDFVLICIFVLISYKSDLYFILSLIWYEKTNLYIGDNRYIEMDGLLKHSSIRFLLQNFYETENFYAIPIRYFGLLSLYLVKKEDNTSLDITSALKLAMDICPENREEYELQNIFGQFYWIFISVIAYLVVFNISLSFPNVDNNKEHSLFVMKTNILNVMPGSKYWDIGLRPYDIPISINNVFLLTKDAKFIEKKLEGKNIKLKVLKFKSGKIEEYIINKH